MYISKEVYYDMTTPDKDEIYTVRQLLRCYNPMTNTFKVGIKLEEIINGDTSIITGKTMDELAYLVEHFVEVQPPMTEEIEELLKVPVKEVEPEYAY
jgi:hypothetical protein